MNKFRRTFALASCIALMMASAAMACLVPGGETINSCIAGIGFYTPHIDKAAFDSGNNCAVVNGIRTSMPMTLWFNVRQRGTEQNPVKIVETKLFYKIIPGNANDLNTDSKWRLARSIDTSRIKMNFTDLVKLFGNLSLTMDIVKGNRDELNPGDAVIFIWYVLYDDSKMSCIPPNPGENIPRFQVNNSGMKNTDYVDADKNRVYNPSFVFKVIYNGLTTP